MRFDCAVNFLFTHFSHTIFFLKMKQGIFSPPPAESVGLHIKIPPFMSF
jgi:hypothetical protein